MDIRLAFLLGFLFIIVATVWGLKFAQRLTGTTKLFADGATIIEDGIEFLRFPFIKRKATFSEIESAEVVPWAKGMASIACVHYGMPVLEIRTRLFSNYVRVKLKSRPRRWYLYYYEYLLFTPENPSGFVQQLNDRITVQSNPSHS